MTASCATLAIDENPPVARRLELAWDEALPMPACGVLLGLSAPGFGIWPMAWLALIPAFLWVQRQGSLKRILASGFWLGFLFQGLYCLWLFDLHPLTWLGFSNLGSRLVTLAAWLLVAVEGGLLTGMLMVGYKLLKPAWLRVLIFPLLWVFGFSLLNWTPLALPWGLLAYTQADLWPMRLLAAGFSGSAVTALLIFHNAVWAHWLSQPLPKAEGRPRRMAPYLAPLLVPALVAAMLRWPAPTTPTRWPMPVAIVQANLPIEIIRSGRLNRDLIEPAYLQPLRKANLPAGTLVVYPEEGVVPGVVNWNTPWQNPLLAELQNLADEKQLYIAVGVTSEDPQARLYNSIALLSPKSIALLSPKSIALLSPKSSAFSLPADQPVQFYHKRRLVPFGEYTPYGFGPALTRLLAGLNVDYAAPFEEGKAANLLQAGRTTIGGLICFELIDSAPVTGGFALQDRQAGAHLLINTSNLGWFHQNPLIEAQFLAIGQMRAAESGLPLVISSNTGISALIGSDGSVFRRTYPLKAGRFHTRILTSGFATNP